MTRKICARYFPCSFQQGDMTYFSIHRHSAFRTQETATIHPCNQPCKGFRNGSSRARRRGKRPHKHCSNVTLHSSSKALAPRYRLSYAMGSIFGHALLIGASTIRSRRATLEHRCRFRRRIRCRKRAKEGKNPDVDMPEFSRFAIRQHCSKATCEKALRTPNEET
jgi:hypothetical protein